MKRLLATVLAGCIAGPVLAEDIPLPRPRPKIPQSVTIGPPPIFIPADALTEPSQCEMAVQQVAVIDSVALLNAADGCGHDNMVRLKAVTLPDKRRIAVNPPAELSCKMALSLANWVREDVAPAFTGKPLASIFNYNSYECRPRNRVFGAKISEHGRGNALDVRAFIMADGSAVDPTDLQVPKQQREKFRKDACARFVTVLGPGSDGHHEKHIHLDMAERRGNYRVCHWAVREPPPVVVAAKQQPAPTEQTALTPEDKAPDQLADASSPDDDAEALEGKPLTGPIPLPKPRPRSRIRGILDRLRL